MAETSRSFLIKFLGDSKDLIKATKDAGDASEQMSGRMTHLAGTIGSAYATAKVVEFAKVSMSAAADDAKAQTVLATAIRNSTGATDDQIASVEDYIAKTQDATGVMDDELRPAFGNLVRVTKDTREAQDLLTLAMDISTATGKDLESTSMAIAKAHEGQSGKLKALGIDIKDADGKTRDFKDIQTQLDAQFGGASAAAADTVAGRAQILQARYADLQETIGAALLPVMDQLVGAASTLVDWFNNLDTGTQTWIVRIALLGGGLVLGARAVAGIAQAYTTYRAAALSAATATGGLVAALGPLVIALGIIAETKILGNDLFWGLHGINEEAGRLRDSKSNVDIFTQGLVDAKNHGVAAAQGLTDSFRSAVEQGQKLFTTTVEGAPVDVFIGDLRRMGVGVTDLVRFLTEGKPALDEWATQMTSGGMSASEVQNRLDFLNPIIDDYTTATRNAARATDSSVSSTLAAAEADKQAAAAAKERDSAIRALFDAIVGAADGTLRYKEAQMASTEAGLKLFEVSSHLFDSNAETRTSLEEVAAESINYEQALRAQATAAASTAEAQAKANGVTDTGSIGAAAYRDELLRIAGTLAPGSDIRNNLEATAQAITDIPTEHSTDVTSNAGDAQIVVDEYGDAIDDIPGNVRTKFSADTGSALSKIGELLGFYARLPGLSGLGKLPIPSATASGNALGGNTGMFARVLVGDNGPEVLDLPTGGHITPNHQLSLGAHGAGRGGDVYQFDFKGAIITNGVDFEDHVHNALLRKRRRCGSLALG